MSYAQSFGHRSFGTSFGRESVVTDKPAPSPSDKSSPQADTLGFSPAQIILPKGGVAIREIGEKSAANPITGTGSLTVPIGASPGRSGFWSSTDRVI
jgi:hypothetical protein